MSASAVVVVTATAAAERPEHALLCKEVVKVMPSWRRFSVDKHGTVHVREQAQAEGLTLRVAKNGSGYFGMNHQCVNPMLTVLRQSFSLFTPEDEDANEGLAAFSLQHCKRQRC